MINRIKGIQAIYDRIVANRNELKLIDIRVSPDKTFQPSDMPSTSGDYAVLIRTEGEDKNVQSAGCENGGWKYCFVKIFIFGRPEREDHSRASYKIEKDIAAFRSVIFGEGLPGLSLADGDTAVLVKEALPDGPFPMDGGQIIGMSLSIKFQYEDKF